MNKIQPQTLKGFRDFLPAEERKRQYVINKLKTVFESFGFEPLETPALEYEEVLLGKYGNEGDKLMYRFTDNGDRRVALRYDQTVPLARVVAQYQNKLPIPFKRYQIQPVWRAENTQKGRFREFLQCDADIVGLDSLYADAEIIGCVVKSLESLGFKDFIVFLNDRSIFSNLIKRGMVSEKDLPKILRILDKLKKIGRDSVVNELVKSGYSNEQSVYFLQTIESTKPTETLETILSITPPRCELRCEFLPTLARGLDYYTGMIFEVEIKEYTVGSVCGGGRYDKLIGMFAGQDIPAVGFAFGFDRLLEAMDELDLFPEDLTTTKVLVTVFNNKLAPVAIDVADRIRSRDINTEIWLDNETKLDKQLKYADQKGIPFAIIIGPDEAAQDKITLKDLKLKTQETLLLDEAISKLTS